MNPLPRDKRCQILSMLVEGSSMRSIARVVDVSYNTVAQLMVRAGEVCAAHHDAMVRNLPCQRIQCDERSGPSSTRRRRTWPPRRPPRLGPETRGPWTALDPDSKLMVSYRVGDRSYDTALRFMRDLRSPLVSRPTNEL